MRLLAAHPAAWTPAGLDTILLWAAQAGHTVQRVPIGAADPGFASWADALIARETPDLVLAFGPGPAACAVLPLARMRDIATLLLLHEDPGQPEPFAAADRILVPSAWLASRLRARYGAVAEILPWPLSPPNADDDGEGRGFLGIVDPTPLRGGAVFGRIAGLLAETRPDIPMLVVAGQGPPDLPGLDEGTLRQIVVSPPLEPAALLALTRVLLMPFVAEDGAALVAAEASMHGVPTIVSDRGALPEMAGPGGLVVQLPPIVLEDPRLLPGAAETSGWVRAIERAWDEGTSSQAACEQAIARHGPATLRAAYDRFLRESC